jgi:hypothetical protein
MEGGAGFLKYVICHVNLGQTCTAAARGSFWHPLAETANGPQLSIERGFKYGKDGILKVLGHGQLLSLGSGARYQNLGRSVNKNKFGQT